MTDLFVCGTDTACGKTVVTAALVLKLGAPTTTVIKPVQTGFPPDDDAAWVASVTGCRTFVWERFGDALAPAVCAEREGRPLDVDGLLRRTLAVRSPNRIAEAAGGLLAPLSGAATMADLAAGLGWPLVVATRPGLGTLNHTALTLEACAARGLDVAGLVVSGYRGGITEETNLERLGRLAPVLGVIGWCRDWGELENAPLTVPAQTTGFSA